MCSPGSEWRDGAAATWWASDVGTDVGTRGCIGSGTRTCGLCRSLKDAMGLLGLGLPRGDPGEGGGDPLESTPPRPTILSMEKPSLGRVGVWMTVEGVGIMTLAGLQAGPTAAVGRRRRATPSLPRSSSFSSLTLDLFLRESIFHTNTPSKFAYTGWHVPEAPINT